MLADSARPGLGGLPPASGRRRSPIFRRERQYWERRLGGLWRLDDLLIVLALLNMCLLPAALLLYPPALLAYAALDEALGLFMAYPAALGIARERQDQTWALLRATPLNRLDIVLDKLAALLSLTGESLGLLARARWLGTLAALPLFGLMLAVRRPFPFSPELPAWEGVLALGAAYTLFVYRPQINSLCGAAVGLACSAGSGVISASLTYTALVNLALLAGGAALILISLQPASLAGLFSDSVLGGRLARVFVWLFPLAGLTLARLLLVPAGLAWAAWRLTRLEG